MKLYIWEGDGISDAYHNDGTLVVLAGSPSEARKIVRQTAQEYRRWRMTYAGPPPIDNLPGNNWDGSDEALDRPPDRVIPLLADTPAQVVAFNGGGYD